MRITRSLHERIEALLKAAGFKLRYEKGNFKGGFCMVEDQMLVVVNKFYPFESKVQLLMDIVAQLELDPSRLSEDQVKLYRDLQTQYAKQAEKAPNLFNSPAGA